MREVGPELLCITHLRTSCVFKAVQGRGRKRDAFWYMNNRWSYSDFLWPWPCLPLVLCRAPIIPDPTLASRTAAYKIFTLTFQIYTLFTLDSIKYLHVMLNMHNIYIALFFFCCKSGRLFGTRPKSWGRIRASGGHVRGQKRYLSPVWGRCSLQRSRTVRTCLREINCPPHVAQLSLLLWTELCPPKIHVLKP